jgi:hypothetical protein
MAVCALLHSGCESSLSFTSVLFFAGRTSLSCLLPSCCLLLAACVLVVRAGRLLASACQCVLATGALVLAFSALRASIWGSHIETPYKKQRLKKAMPFDFYGGPRPASRALPAAAAAPCSLAARWGGGGTRRLTFPLQHSMKDVGIGEKTSSLQVQAAVLGS